MLMDLPAPDLTPIPLSHLIPLVLVFIFFVVFIA